MDKDYFRECCCSVPILLAELIFFLYKTGESMLDATTRPYIIKVVCHSRFPNNDSLCQNLDSDQKLEDEIQAQAGAYLMYYRVLVNFPAIILGLFCGAWSDKYGRKIPMMLPSLGSVFSVLFYMLSLTTTDGAIPCILCGAFIQGIFGKSSVITMAVNSYASEISDKSDRTQKLGKLLAMNFFGLFAGALLSGIFQDLSDLPQTFLVVVFFHTASLLITVFCMPETIPLREEVEEKKDPKPKSRMASIKHICVSDNIKASINVLTRQRQNHGRKLILVLFLVSLLNQTCKVGETDVTLLFVTRSPLSWHKSWYGYLLSVDYAVMGICLIVFLPILSNLLKVPDVAIVLAGLCCKIVRLTWAGFCTETWMVYVSVIIGSFAGLITSSIRSLMSKSVEEHELGKVFSLLASGETASKLFGTVIFVSIYGATAFFFPGFAYIIEALVYIFMATGIIYMYSDFKMVGTFDLISAFSSQTVYGTTGSVLDKGGRSLEVVDELEEDPVVPQLLPATTP